MYETTKSLNANDQRKLIGEYEIEKEKYEKLKIAFLHLNISDSIYILNEEGLSIDDPEIRRCLIEAYAWQLKCTYGFGTKFNIFIKVFPLSDEEKKDSKIIKAIEAGYIYQYTRGDFENNYFFNDVQEVFGIEPPSKDVAGVREAVVEGLGKAMHLFHTKADFEKLLTKFGLDFNDQKIQTMLHDTYKRVLLWGNDKVINNIKNIANSSVNDVLTLTQEEIFQLAEVSFENSFESGLRLIEKCGLSVTDKSVRDFIINHYVSDSYENSKSENFKLLNSRLNLTEQEITLPALQNVFSQLISFNIKRRNIDNILYFKNFSSLNNDEFNKKYYSDILNFLKNVLSDITKLDVNKLDIFFNDLGLTKDDEKLKKIVVEKIIDELVWVDSEKIIEVSNQICDYFNFSKDTFRQPDNWSLVLDKLKKYSGWFSLDLALFRFLGITKEDLKKDEFQKIIENNYINHILEKTTDLNPRGEAVFKRQFDEFNLDSNPNIRRAKVDKKLIELNKNVSQYLNRSDLDFSLFTKEELVSDEITNIHIKKFNNAILSGRDTFSSILKYLEQFELLTENYKVRLEIKNNSIEIINSINDPNRFADYVDNFLEGNYSDPLIYQKALKMLDNELDSLSSSKLLVFLKKFKIDTNNPIVFSWILNKFEKTLNSGDSLKEIIDLLNFSNISANHPNWFKFQEVAVHLYVFNISQWGAKENNLLEVFGLSVEDSLLRKVAIKNYITSILKIPYNPNSNFYELFDEFKFTEQELNLVDYKNIRIQTLIKMFENKNNNYTNFHKYIKYFNITAEEISSEEIKNLSKVYLENRIINYRQYDHNYFNQLKTEAELFNFSLDNQLFKNVFTNLYIKLVLDGKIIFANNVINSVYGQEINVGDFTRQAEPDVQLLLANSELGNEFNYEKIEINQLFNKFIDTKILGVNGEKVDLLVKEQYEFIENLLGKEKIFRIFSFCNDFLKNPHDALLFVDKLQNLSKENIDLMMRCVLNPILTSDTNLIKFNELLNSFDINEYADKFSGNPPTFSNWSLFEREVALQKANIVIPEQASDNFKETISQLIIAPGVDVDFIKTLVNKATSNLIKETPVEIKKNIKEEILPYNDYSDQEYYYDLEDNINNYNQDYEDDEQISDQYDDFYTTQYSFADSLLEIIDNPESIDDNQLIAPWNKKIPFDPVHRLVYAAIGIHSLNTMTPKLIEKFEQNESLQAILKIFERIDNDKKDAIENDYWQKIAREPARRARLLADKAKELQQWSIIKRDSVTNSFSHLRIENHEQYQMLFDEESTQDIKNKLKEAFVSDRGLYEIVLGLLDAIGQRGEKIFECIDLVPFVDILPVASKVKEYFEIEINKKIKNNNNPELSDKERFRQARQETLSNVEVNQLMDWCKDNQIRLTELLLYFGYNNRTRQSRSKDIKNSLDAVLKQKKYKDKIQDPFLGYINGNLLLDEADDLQVRDILKKYGYDQIGRQLKIEIAKKSDPRGWVCGDYTNCCMPFTSAKNQEYLLRPDMAYFLVSIEAPNGTEDLVAQSVLVSAKTYSNDSVVAIDNIEIANRAIRYRSIVAQAYEELKNELIKRYKSDNKNFQLVIGTTYNDDGGLVTANCQLAPVSASPVGGDMLYSDWLRHTSNYVYYDSNKNENVQKHFGLQIDLFDRSRVHEIIFTLEERDQVQRLLETIGKGEDDGDGGLSFSDNYSAVIERDGQVTGYVIAADYLQSEEDDDYIFIEKIHFKESVDIEQQKVIFNDYLTARRFNLNEGLDGIIIRPEVVNDSPWIEEVMVKQFGEQNVKFKKKKGLKVLFDYQQNEED